MHDGKVLVYGATGAQGSPVVEQLLDAGRRVRAVTRDAERAQHWAARGAEVAVADLGQPETLKAANEGIDMVVLQLPLQYDFALHEAYGRNAIDAARAAGVELVVFNTSAHVIPDADVHIYQVRQEVVDYLHDSGVPSIVLRPTFYMEILLGPWIRPGIVDNGVMAFPLPADFPMSWVSASEMGAYSVAALDRPDLAGRTFDIGGPEALTGSGMAAQFSDLLRSSVSYMPIPPDAYEQALAPMFGPTVAFEVASQVRYIIGTGDGSIDMKETAAEFSVEPVTLQQWLRGHEWRTGSTGP
ncbi:NmrA family NAD(P)-binding protein [Microbacterium sp. 2FI]|uniref:SDR family oxidoreductase n=1 Tax=Microbacterium sp. 2FI TaxID=2502193 RepID=UPI0010F950F7|nr:NmrA family NAD(P)-binding protein [Microbacterium sp. 2FI]